MNRTGKLPDDMQPLAVFATVASIVDEGVAAIPVCRGEQGEPPQESNKAREARQSARVRSVPKCVALTRAHLSFRPSHQNQKRNQGLRLRRARRRSWWLVSSLRRKDLLCVIAHRPATLRE